MNLVWDILEYFLFLVLLLVPQKYDRPFKV